MENIFINVPITRFLSKLAKFILELGKILNGKCLALQHFLLTLYIGLPFSNIHPSPMLSRSPVLTLYFPIKLTHMHIIISSSLYTSLLAQASSRNRWGWAVVVLCCRYLNKINLRFSFFLIISIASIRLWNLAIKEHLRKCIEAFVTWVGTIYWHSTTTIC